MSLESDTVPPPVIGTVSHSYLFLFKNYRSAILIAAPNVALVFLNFNFFEGMMPLQLRVPFTLFIYPFIRDLTLIFTSLSWMHFFNTQAKCAYTFFRKIRFIEVLFLGFVLHLAVRIFALIFAHFINLAFWVILFLKHLIVNALYQSVTDATPIKFDFWIISEIEIIEIVSPFTLIQSVFIFCIFLYSVFYTFFSSGLFMAALADLKNISFWKAEYLALGLKHRFALTALLTSAPLIVVYTLLSPLMPVLSGWQETILLPLVYSLQLFLWSSCAAAYYQWAILYRNVDFEAP